MKLKISKYWLFQIGGWSTYIIVYTFFYLTLRTKEQPNFFEVLMLDAVLGIGITHLMRLFIRKVDFLSKPLNRQITAIAVGLGIPQDRNINANGALEWPSAKRIT